MDLSVIIPCYEEHECLPLLFDRITEALGTTGLSYELVFVNDGLCAKRWCQHPGKGCGHRLESSVTTLRR